MTEKSSADNFPAGYEVPKVWTWDKANGGQFANINRPIAGPTHDKDLPVGTHPLQLYSLATPNGVKVTIMLEELLEAGHTGAEYDAWLIRIGDGDQFGSGFVDVNPNSKIPALMDRSTPEPTRVFESGSILLYLAEKFGAFLPKDHKARTETMNWLFWQMGSAPYLGGGFGHFYAYAPMHIQYAIDRFSMEVKRQLDVLDRHLADNRYMAGSDYSIADIAIWPWYGNLVQGKQYGESGTFLDVQSYKHVQRWTAEIADRPAVQRGRMVNRMMGDPSEQLHERHDASDFETKTQDKIAPRRRRKETGMRKRPDMTKHRGFPSGMPGHGHHFTIRRANEKGVTPLKALQRLARANSIEARVDAAFLHALWHHFGAEPFERGNLDAGRLNLLFGREVVPAEEPFDPTSYEALLRIDERVGRRSFPEAFKDVMEV